ncbi:MAG TPA: hypothetical protein VNW46_18850, partial [Gemmatimonadaceae bacterium]|nr:hypothetical protein [Gemmatimonadaceae bacterium]
MGVLFATYTAVRSPRIPHGIRHLPFFEALAEMGEESHPDWVPLQAGLLVLRLTDGWLQSGRRAAQASPRGIRAVRASVRKIDRRHPVRRPLARLVASIHTSALAHRHRPTRDVAPLAPWLFAYGRALGLTGWPALAADVYDTTAAHLSTGDHADLLIEANLRLGAVARTAGDSARAMLAYERAATLAAAAGDVVGALRAEAGTAALAVTDAPTARHGRDRLRYALATLFFDLGVTTAARDAFLVLATTADRPYVRWLATQALAASPLAVAAGYLPQLPLPHPPSALADRLSQI